MIDFKEWLIEMEAATTSSASIAPVPMRLLSDKGRGYIGVPGRPSPYDPKGGPTVIRRPSVGGDTEDPERFDYPWLDDHYNQPKQRVVNSRKTKRRGK